MYKGILYHTLAKLSFIFGSYIMHYFLGQYLPAEQYGLTGTIITIINLEYLLVNNGVRQAISNAVSTGKYNSQDIIKKGLVLQGGFILIIVTVVVTLAPFLAMAFHHQTFSFYTYLTIPIVVCMGIYFALLGILNGAKAFKTESGILIVYPLLKLAVIPFSLFFFQDPTIGAECGFLFAGFFILIICCLTLIHQKKIVFINGERIPWKLFIKSAFQFSLIFIAASIIMNIDLLLVRAFSNNPAYTGYYTGIMNFAKVPYFLLTAAFLVILPVITTLYADNQLLLLQKRITQLLDLITATVLPVVCLIASTAPTLLSVYYKPEYVIAAPALCFLVFGTFFLGVTVVICMILSAMNYKIFTSSLAGILLVTDCVVCFIFTKHFSYTGAAFSSTLCCGCAMVAAFIFLSMKAGKLLSLRFGKLILGNLLLSGIAYLGSRFFSFTLLSLIIFFIALYCCFLILLFVTRTFTKADLKNIKKSS